MPPAASSSFTLRELLQRLPSDGATLFVRVSGVASSMSHHDICELLCIRPASRAALVEWRHCCSVLRTDFVVQLASIEEARDVMLHVNSGITFLEKRLQASFVQGFPPLSTVEYQGARFESEPRLYYALPSNTEADVAKRQAEAVKRLGQAAVIPKPKSWWVDTR